MMKIPEKSQITCTNLEFGWTRVGRRMLTGEVEGGSARRAVGAAAPDSVNIEKSC